MMVPYHALGWEGKTQDSFGVTSCNKQGDVLSPVLFNMVVDWITRRIFNEEDGIVWVGESRLSDQAYADDIALLSEDAHVMNRMTGKLAREAGRIGLEINLRKSKMMTVQNSEDVRVELGEDIIGEVDSFEYLGSVVYKDEDVRKEVGIRIGKAGSIFSKMKKIWNSRGISLNTKIKLFNGTVIPIVMYGSETWKGLKDVENSLRVFESNCLRKIIDIRWYEHITEEEVRTRSGQQNIVQRMRLQRWRYYGHALRMDEERLPKQLLSWTPVGSRHPGRPKDTWRRTIDDY